MFIMIDFFKPKACDLMSQAFGLIAFLDCSFYLWCSEYFMPKYPLMHNTAIHSSHKMGLELPVLGTESYSDDSEDGWEDGAFAGCVGAGCWGADPDGVVLYLSSGVSKLPSKR